MMGFVKNRCIPSPYLASDRYDGAGDVFLKPVFMSMVLDAGDKIWLTCSALHNMLLEHDGLDERWGA
jgi:hypothetical protein